MFHIVVFKGRWQKFNIWKWGILPWCHPFSIWRWRWKRKWEWLHDKSRDAAGMGYCFRYKQLCFVWQHRNWVDMYEDNMKLWDKGNISECYRENLDIVLIQYGSNNKYSVPQQYSITSNTAWTKSGRTSSTGIFGWAEIYCIVNGAKSITTRKYKYHFTKLSIRN